VPDRDYENPWRPNHESLAVALWLGLGAIAWSTADRWALDPRPFRAFTLVALLITLTWLPGMVRVWQRHARLRAGRRRFSTPRRCAADSSAAPMRSGSAGDFRGSASRHS